MDTLQYKEKNIEPKLPNQNQQYQILKVRMKKMKKVKNENQQELIVQVVTKI